jgi:hypothetical protein
MAARKKKNKPIPFPEDDPEKEHVVQLLVTVPVFGRQEQVIKSAQSIRKALRVSLHSKIEMEILSIGKPRTFKTIEVPEPKKVYVE